MDYMTNMDRFIHTTKKDWLVMFALLAVICGGTWQFTRTIYGSIRASNDEESEYVAAIGITATGSIPGSASIQNESFKSIGKPARIVIPAIDVDATIVEVGRNAKGNMSIPKKFEDVGWYKHGPKPGDSGNAVVAGHVDNGLGLPAVFKHLNELRSGHEITIIDEQGNTAKFRVTGTRIFNHENGDTADVFGHTTGTHLNLVTCDGVWIKEKKTYSKRLVVFTERVE